MGSSKVCPSCKQETWYKAHFCPNCKYDFVKQQPAPEPPPEKRTRRKRQPKAEEETPPAPVRRGKPTRVQVPALGWHGRDDEDPPWLKYTGDGNDNSLIVWSRRVSEKWLEAYNEVLTNEAIMYLADLSESAALRRHTPRLGELLARRTKGARTINDYFVCPICRHDWHEHFAEKSPVRCQHAKCDCREATRI